MDSSRTDERISCFLACVSPVVIDCIRIVFAAQGLDVEQQGSGLDLVFSIKTCRGEAKFFIHNLLLEIATVDRDEDPLRFDERLMEPGFFRHKVTNVIGSKLRVLFHVLNCDDFDQGMKSIESLAGDYERLRIWRIDNPAGTKGGEQ